MTQLPQLDAILVVGSLALAARLLVGMPVGAAGGGGGGPQDRAGATRARGPRGPQRPAGGERDRGRVQGDGRAALPSGTRGTLRVHRPREEPRGTRR